MKNILLLGATGSIGESVLSVISQNKESLNLFFTHSNIPNKQTKDIANENIQIFLE